MSFSISDPSTRTWVSVSFISMNEFTHCTESLNGESPACSPYTTPCLTGEDARRSNLHGILNSLSDTSNTSRPMNQQTAKPLVPIDQLVRDLRALPASAFDETETIRSLLAQSPVDEASLAPYLTWNRQHYTRNLIDKTELYELVAICWEAGQCSSVHNHRDQNCWMAAPAGKLIVENFHVGFQDVEAGKCQLAASNS